MRSLDKINEYAASVCQQIRWKKARVRVSDEITNHIVDGRDSYITQGLDEQAATDKAIADTGDSMTIGTQLDRIHRPKPQWAMFAWVAGFLLLGLSFSLFLFDDANIPRRLLWTAVGIAVMMGAYFMYFTILGKYPRRICLGVGLLMAVMYGMRLSIPPVVNMGHYSQVIILVLPVVLAPIIYVSRNKRYWGLAGSLLAYGLLSLVTLSAPALSGFIHFTIIGACLLIIAVIKNWFGVNRVIGTLSVIIPHIVL